MPTGRTPQDRCAVVHTCILQAHWERAIKTLFSKAAEEQRWVKCLSFKLNAGNHTSAVFQHLKELSTYFWFFVPEVTGVPSA